MTKEDLPQLPPSGIGEAAKYNFSPWFIKLRLQDQSILENRTWKEATKPLSVLQSNIGNQFEKQVYNRIEPQSYERVNEWFDWGSGKNKEQIIEEVKKVSNRKDTTPTILTQARLSGKIKLFNVLGDADLIILYPTDYGVHAHVIDIKSSWDEKPYQQLQTATYTILLRKILSDEDINFTIGGGIIYRETDLDSVFDIDNKPEFHIETREGDVKRVLSEGGKFENAFNTDYDNLSISIENTSPYAEVTIVEAIENNDLGLLGLSPSEKKSLEKYHITTIEDMAELYNLIEDSKPYDYDEPEVNPAFRETVEKIQEDTSLSNRLPLISQQAQAYLGDLKPDHEYAHSKPWFSWLKGVGSAEIPEDNPSFDTDLPMIKNNMIRVYLNIQYDHVRDSLLAISGRVDCGNYDGTPLTFSRVVSGINRDNRTWSGAFERELLEDSITDIFKSINLMAGLTNQQNNAAIHFYMYGEDEYDALYESIKKHQNTLSEASSMRKLLDSRDGIDQSIVSIIEPEIENRFALKQIDTSLPAIYNRTFPNDAYAEFSNSDWKISHSNGSEINLKEAFKQQLFDFYTPIKQDSGKLATVLTDNNNTPDDFYALLPRSGAQIPVEYFWASEEVDILDSSWANKKNQESVINSFRWVDSSKKDTRISLSLCGLLSSKLTHTLHHVERSISYRSTDIQKELIDVSNLSDFEPNRGDLASACFDYLDLEYLQTKKDAFDVYKEPFKKRILDGESLPIRITEIKEDRGYMFRAEGELLFDELGFENPLQIAGSSRIGGSDETTGGTRCVATPLSKENGEYVVDSPSPKQIAHGLKVSVESYEPNKNSIVIDGYRTSKDMEYKYVLPRKSWTLDSKNNHQLYVGKDEMFVLDPNPDNTMAEKSIKALRHASSNPVYQDINKIRNGSKNIQESDFCESRIQEYLDWSKDALEFTPNEKQKKFIKETSRYSLLQGPPGTGKTSGATAHAILSRAYDGQLKDDRTTGLISGLSNKSVDEVLDDVANLLETFDNEFDNHKLENTRLVRLAYNEPENSSDKVEYLNYNNDNDIEILRNIIMDVGQSHQQTLNTSNSDGLEHLFVFATPGRVDGLIGKLFPKPTTAEDGYERAYNFFDVLAIDEASMMPMHQLFMTSAFINKNAQVMLSGDQRQLSPVQTYEWKDESRTSITQHLPYLSALDYFRYLRGDTIEFIPDESPDSPNADIPISRLNETFRCHETVTEFLRQYVYDQDDINYISNQTELLDDIDCNVDGINSALEPDSALTILIHDDDKSRQVNEVEGTILSALTKFVPEKNSIGIVTPHNAQKGKLNVICDNSHVDTVERFQGGEKDIMFLSTTVSDPSHLSKEEEFILSLNRLNVALSRMKKKLVVLVPQTIFELVPKDIDVYDQARIWKALFAISAARQDSDWSGTVGEFTGAGTAIPGSNTNVEVYNIKDL